MNRRLLRGGIAIAAACMLQAALADKNDPPVITPFSILQRPDRLDDCHSDSGGDLGRNVELKVELTIATDGAIKAFSLPEGSPEWMKDLSGCALNQFRFSPATRDGTAVETKASLSIKFRARGAGQSAGLVIDNVGPLIVPPKILSGAGEIDSCFPESVRRQGVASRFVTTITILPDGSLRDLMLPPGSDSWQEAAARCALEKLTFLPGTLDGIAVEAHATLPIEFNYNNEKSLVTPKIRSTADQIEAAYSACYPSDSLTMTSAIYRFDVSIIGHVSNPKVVKSSGDPRLDESGACILKMLRFFPMKQNGQTVNSYMTLELPLRPHR